MGAQPGMVPPHDLEVEKSILGAVFANNEALGEAFEVMTTADFYQPGHAEIAAAMLMVEERREAVDVMSVTDELKSRGSLLRVGGTAYLEQLRSAVQSAANVSTHVRIVRRLAQLRAVARVGGEISTEALNKPSDVDGFLESAAGRMFEACFSAGERNELQPLREILAAGIKEFDDARQGKTPIGLVTEWPDLTDVAGAFRPEQLVFIAARPSMGKTALAVDAVRQWALAQKAIVFFSLEMGSVPIAQRLLCCHAGVNFMQAEHGRIDQATMERLRVAQRELAVCEIFIDERGGRTPRSVINRCRQMARLSRNKRLDAIVLDYVQLMRADREVGNEQENLTAISRELKRVACEYRCPMVVLSS